MMYGLFQGCLDWASMLPKGSRRVLHLTIVEIADRQYVAAIWAIHHHHWKAASAVLFHIQAIWNTFIDAWLQCKTEPL